MLSALVSALLLAAAYSQVSTTESLISAIASGDPSSMSRLLETSSIDDKGYALLLLASRPDIGSDRQIQAFSELVSDISIPEGFKVEAFASAVECGSVPKVSTMLELLPGVITSEQLQASLERTALEMDFPELAHVLIQYGAVPTLAMFDSSDPSVAQEKAMEFLSADDLALIPQRSSGGLTSNAL